MDDQLTSPQATELFRKVLSLKNEKECRAFFRDLCTIGEIEAMVERYQVAKLIDQKVPYREISRQTGSSTATITRVAHWMHHGMGGYRLMLDRAP